MEKKEEKSRKRKNKRKATGGKIKKKESQEKQKIDGQKTNCTTFQEPNCTGQANVNGKTSVSRNVYELSRNKRRIY